LRRSANDHHPLGETVLVKPVSLKVIWLGSAGDQESFRIVRVDMPDGTFSLMAQEYTGHSWMTLHDRDALQSVFYNAMISLEQVNELAEQGLRSASQRKVPSECSHETMYCPQCQTAIGGREVEEGEKA
jgi:hypothetical protein